MPLAAHAHQALLVFIKNPRAGYVKTRIAQELGDEKALRIYQLLLTSTRQTTEGLPFRKFLFYSDFVDETDEWNSPNYEKKVQHGPTLGDRMNDAFQKVLAEKGVTRAIIVGSDCPELSGSLLIKAFIALETHDFVIGPARDGGYYLLGMKQVEGKIFRNKTWSTASVLRDTLDDLGRLNKSFYLLPVLSDVDTVADLPAEMLDQITRDQG
ncbi:MAG: TIGR04282 family arsenosugar biosynthesis glycosyltransferase [Cytophagaceae bacterium]|nr:TIGR04282 family arsenosugar biosynthesis glycosyltransferase [Cytophagaceae bacterium]